MRTIADVAKRDARWAAVGVLVCLWVGWRVQSPLGIAAAAVFLAQAVLLWKNTKAGVYLALGTSLFLAAWFGSLLLSKGGSWSRAGLFFFMLVGVWAYWSSYGALLRGKAGWQDPEDEDERPAADEGEPERPMTSIVLLRSRPKYLDSKVLLESVRDAWDESRQLGEDDLFVAGDGPVFMLKSPQGMWMVHNHARPYFDGDDPAQKIPELRLRKAVEEHAAWLSVDLMHGFEEGLPSDVYYPYIFRLIRELADEDTLAILRPESGHINVWTEEVAARLGSIDPLEEFATPAHSPVIQVSDEDPRMKGAVEEARRSFPDFRKRWSGRGAEDSFIVKAAIRRDGVSEIIWIEVTGLEPGFIHGTLANQPVNLSDLKSGDTVEVPVGDLYDWAIASEGMKSPLGMYTEKVVRAVERESREAFEQKSSAAADGQA